MSTVYGPVPSWRLGRSLGVDIILPPKKCTFNCIYCQLGKTRTYVTCPEDLKDPLVSSRKVLQDMDDILGRMNFDTVDTVTFSGCGEPTLNTALGEIAEEVRTKIIPKPMAVLTNASLLHREDIRRNLIPFDLVVAKLDAGEDETLRAINRPADKHLSSELITDSIKRLKCEVRDNVALEVMLLDSEVKGITNVERNKLKELVNAVLDIEPDLVYLEVPFRPPSESYVKRPSQKKIRQIYEELSEQLDDERVWAYGIRSKNVDRITWLRHKPLEFEVLELLKRRPCRAVDISVSLGLELDIVQRLLKSLKDRKRVDTISRNGEEYNLAKEL